MHLWYFGEKNPWYGAIECYESCQGACITTICRQAHVPPCFLIRNPSRCVLVHIRKLFLIRITPYAEHLFHSDVESIVATRHFVFCQRRCIVCCRSGFCLSEVVCEVWVETRLYLVHVILPVQVVFYTDVTDVCFEGDLSSGWWFFPG